MTQYEIELIQEAQNRKWEKEKRVEIFTINTLMRMFSKNAKSYGRDCDFTNESWIRFVKLELLR